MKVPPLVQVLVAGAFAWGLSEGLPVWQFDGALVTVGVWIASIVGAGFLAIALNIFRIHKTTFDPLNPSKAQKLVVSGLYRITRNPMYVGMAFLLLGWCLYLGGRNCVSGDCLVRGVHESLANQGRRKRVAGQFWRRLFAVHAARATLALMLEKRNG